MNGTYLKIFLSILALATFCQSSNAKLPGSVGDSPQVDEHASDSGGSEQQTLKSRVIPCGTKLAVTLNDFIDSNRAKEGDCFTAQIVEDKDVDGLVALRSGGIVTGNVGFLKSLKPSNGAKAMFLTFASIDDASGKTIPLSAHIVEHGAAVHAKRGLKDVMIPTKPTKTLMSGSWGLQAPVQSEFQFDDSNLPRGSTALLVPKLLKVDLRPGDEIKIELDDDLTVSEGQDR